MCKCYSWKFQFQLEKSSFLAKKWIVVLTMLGKTYENCLLKFSLIGWKNNWLKWRCKHQKCCDALLGTLLSLLSFKATKSISSSRICKFLGKLNSQEKFAKKIELK